MPLEWIATGTVTSPPTGSEVATDTFNRADQTPLGTSDTGQVWSAASYSVESNVAKSTGAASNIAHLECFNPDVSVSVTMSVNNAAAEVGLIIRHSAGAYIKVVFTGGNLEVIEHSLFDSTIASVAQTASSGLRLTVTAEGTSIKVYIDNVLKISTTSTVNQFIGTQNGLWSDLESIARFEDFNITTPVPINVSDDFNRANDATSLGTASDGVHTWHPYAGTWGIQTNQGYQPAGIFGVATVISNRFDGTIQVTLPDNSTNGGGLAFRCTDGSNFIRVAWNVGSLAIIKRVAGVDTTLNTVVFANANGQVLKVILSGSSIDVYVDNVLKVSATETFNMLATQHGLFSGSAPSIRYDDFSIVA